MLPELPYELIEKIVSHLSVKDAKSLSLLSKSYLPVCQSKIWKAPRFKRRLLPTELKSLTDLPIREFHIMDLKFTNAFEITEVLQIMGNLKILHLDGLIDPKHMFLFRKLDIDLVVYAQYLKAVPAQELSCWKK